MRYEKGTFIIIPNKEILRGKSSEMQSIFFWLCEHANDNGVSFPSRRRLAKESGVGIRTLDKNIEEMVLLGILNKTTRNQPGKRTNLSNLYQIVVNETVVSKSDPVSEKILPSVQNDTPPSVKKDSVTVSNINSIHLTDTVVAKAEKEPFDSNKEIEKMLSYNTYWMNILGIFLKRKKVQIRDEKQMKVITGRWVRVAKQLEAFDRQQIVNKVKECEEMRDGKGNPINWSLETVLKLLTK